MLTNIVYYVSIESQGDEKNMKATVKYVNGTSKRQRTIEVDKNEPNYILRTLYNQFRLPKDTFVTTIKCGRTEYQWFGELRGCGIY